MGCKNKNKRSNAKANGAELGAVTAMIREAYRPQREQFVSDEKEIIITVDDDASSIDTNTNTNTTGASDDGESSTHKRRRSRSRSRQCSQEPDSDRSSGNNSSSCGGGGFMAALSQRIHEHRAKRQTRIVASGYDALTDPRVPLAVDDDGNMYLTTSLVELPWDDEIGVSKQLRGGSRTTGVQPDAESIRSLPPPPPSYEVAVGAGMGMGSYVGWERY
ncbi:hypothetical protein AAE478_008906 [Parahypoxylon ruwenzoriense]